MLLLLFLGFVLGQEDRYAGNPIIKTIFTADPSAHVWGDGRLYLYPSHDIYPPRGCDLMDNYHIFSTVDMVVWRDEGQIVSSEDVEWGRPEGGFMWAPDAAFKNGKYYYYFPHPSGSTIPNPTNGSTDWDSTWKIGVAVSDYPNKGFEVKGFIEELVAYPFIDPCVFTDSDGQSYIYIGGGDAAYGGKLGADMMTIDGGMKLLHNGRDNNQQIPDFQPKYINGLDDFHEGSWVFKRGEIYYYMYADNNPSHNQQRYATASNPLGPFTNKGVLLGPNNCDTSHGSIVEFNKHWYIFYHNADISAGRGNIRSVCADEVFFNDDGTIQPVVQTTRGVQAIAPAEPVSPLIATYPASGAVLDGGAVLDNGAVGNTHLTDAKATFSVDGGANGGRATIGITYSLGGDDADPTSPKEAAMFKLAVNGKDWSYLNLFATGSWTNFTGYAYITVFLKAGPGNQVVISHGDGGANIQKITVEPLDG